MNSLQAAISGLIEEWELWVEKFEGEEGAAYSQVFRPELIAGYRLKEADRSVSKALFAMDKQITSFEDKAEWIFLEEELSAVRILYGLYPFKNKCQQRQILERIDFMLHQVRSHVPVVISRKT